MSLPRRAHAAVPVAIGGLIVAIAQLHGHMEVVLPVVPLLLLVLSLVLGQYPGCDVAMRFSERIVARSRTRIAAGVGKRRSSPLSHPAHGGLLLALSLSGRAPPA